MNIQSLNNKISLGVGLCVLGAALAVAVYSAIALRSHMMRTAEVESVAVGHATVAVIESRIQRELEVANTLAQTFAAMKNEDILLDPERMMIQGILRTTLEENEFLTGIFTCWEPNGFDGDDENFVNGKNHDVTGRFAVYLGKDSEGKTEARSLLSDPERSLGGIPGTWYEIPRETRRVYVSDPFATRIAGTQEMIITMSVPVIANGEFYGVVGLDMNLAFLQKMMDDKGSRQFSGTTSVITNTGTLAGVSDRPDLAGKQLATVDFHSEQDLDLIRRGQEVQVATGDAIALYMPLSVGNPDTPWAVKLMVPLNEYAHAAAAETWKMMVIALVFVGIAFILLRYITGETIGPLSQVLDLAASLAQGDLTGRLNMARKDEIGSLADALDRSCDSLAKMIREITSNAEIQASASQGMSTVSSQLASASEEMRTQVESVAGATEEMSASINSMASAAEEMSVNIQSVSATAEQMSQNMNSIASSIEQMSTSIEDVAVSAKDGSIIAKQAMEMSVTASQTMSVLGKAAKEIGEVTNLIKQIADQTNLLALNATIEAASAGDAGRGFAVVANEIKELARQSGRAANEIAQRVRGVQGNTGSAVEAIAGITDIIQRMNESSAGISKSVEEQTGTALEISDSVQQATAGITNIAASIAEMARGANDVSKSAAESARVVTEVSANIQGLSRAADESNAGAQQVSETSSELARISAQLRDLAGNFKVSAG